MKTAAKHLVSLCAFALLSATLAYSQTTFQHIIWIVQENRTPDNLFQGLCAPPFGSPALCPSKYNISPNATVPPALQVALTPDPLTDDINPNHTHKSFSQMYNNGGINLGPIRVACDNKSMYAALTTHPLA
jgi:hypothetical protein